MFFSAILVCRKGVRAGLNRSYFRDLGKLVVTLIKNIAYIMAALVGLYILLSAYRILPSKPERKEWKSRRIMKSATTQVNVLSAEIINIAFGQGFHFQEASTATCANGECVNGVSESETVAGKLTFRIGTCENHIAPNRSFQQAEEGRRKYRDMVVELTHSRGAVGVMLGESLRK